jgi:hypothetical protein
MNDRHVTVFSEYFTSDEFTDKKLSNNVKVDEAFSALTLLPANENKDNSNAVDAGSIYLLATNKNNDQLSSIYPLCNQPYNINASDKEDNKYYLGFGISLSSEKEPTSNNIMYASSSNSENKELSINRDKIQNQCLFYGDIPESHNTRGEFELIFNDFNNKDSLIYNSIYKSIKLSSLNTTKTNIDKDHIIINDNDFKSSFNGSYKENEKILTDNNTLLSNIESIGLTFNIKDNSKIGSITALKLTFFGGQTNLSIPDIDYTKSYIITYDGQRLNPFNNLVDNKTTNSVVESKLLLLDDIVTRPKIVYIAFKLDTMNLSPITKYLGVLWKVPLKGTGIVANISVLGGVGKGTVNSDTFKFAYVYHDIKRASETEIKKLNFKVLQSILESENKFEEIGLK